jgi:hypothetical protein
MKETPILFSTPMVQAILEGRKTQTRRIIKPQPSTPSHITYLINEPIHICPYGLAGDTLWVRETWATSKALNHTKPSDLLPGFGCEYKAGGTSLHGINNLVDRGRWRTSIHMPKVAARIWLEITDVRVERLRDISEKDAINEGIEKLQYGKPGLNQYSVKTKDGIKYGYSTNCETAKECFNELWASINGQESLETNPWVWVIDFKRIEKHN